MYTGSLAAVSNREDWFILGTLVDEDGSDIILTAATFEIFICRQSDPGAAVLSGSTADGKITLSSSTILQCHFTPGDMDVLCAGTYDVFLRVTIDDIVAQVLSASVPIIEGGPTS